MDKSLWNQIENFKPYEFDSHDSDGSGAGTGYNMKESLVFKLDALRNLVGARFRVNSGLRTEKHNKSVGGAPSSAHLTGEAVDISTSGWTHEQKKDFVIYARKMGFNGIGVAKTFIHLDIKPRVAAWRYTPTGQVAIPVGDEYKWI